MMSSRGSGADPGQGAPGQEARPRRCRPAPFRLSRLLLAGALACAMPLAAVPLLPAAASSTPGRPPPAPPVPTTPQLAPKEEILRRLVERLIEAYEGPPPSLMVQAASTEEIDGIPDGDELILELKLEDLLVSSTIIGIKQGSAILLPLAELTNAFSFAIDVNPGQRRAEGWFIRENRRFQLDVRSGQAIVDGISYPFTEGMVEPRDTDIYVSHQLLSTWFGLGLVPDMVNLAVVALPSTPLPIQERLSREQRMQGGAATSGASASTLPLLDTPTAFLGWPVLDVSVGSRLAKAPGERWSYGVDYGVQGTADVAFLSADFFATGSPVSSGRGRAIDLFRTTLSREDHEGRWPLGITKVQLGEVRPLNTPLLMAGFERGLLLTNEPLNMVPRFDSVDIEGQALPGWDADLFQNGVLVASQRVGGDGRYLFSSRDLFIGDNDFRVVLYGPQGQVREETRRIPLGAGLATTGTVPWTFSVTQRDLPIYNADFQRDDTLGGLRIAGSASYGLSRNLTLSAAAQSVDLGKDWLHAGQLGAVTQLGGVLLSTSAATTHEGGYALTGSAQTQIGRERMYLTYGRSDGIFGAGLTQSSTLAVAGGRQRGRSSFSYGMSASYREDGFRDVLSASLRGGLTIPGYSLLGSVTGERVNGEDKLLGSVQGYARFGSMLVRGQVNADLYPTFDIGTIALSTNLAIRPLDQMALNLSYEPITETYQVSATYDLSGSQIRIGPSVSYSESGAFGIGLTLGTSLYRQPATGTVRMVANSNETLGRIAVRILEDVNQNGIVDPDDVPMEGVAVRVVPGDMISAATDAKGATLVSDLVPGQPVDLLLDEMSLPDPFHRQLGDGFSIRPRRGSIPGVDILVGMTDEVYGTVLVEDRAGNPQPVNGMRLRLVREGTGREVAGSSDADGRVFLGNLHHGTFTVSVEAADVRRMGGILPDPVSFTVPATGTIAEIPPIIVPRRHKGWFLSVGDTRSELGRAASLLVLRRRAPEVLTRLPLHTGPDVDPAQLLLGPVPTREQADAYCATIREAGRSCNPV